MAKEDRSMSMARANWLTIVVMGPVAAAMMVVYLLWHGGSVWDGFVAPGWALLAFAVGVVVHEGIHGAVWAVASERPSAIRFGFQWKTLTPFAHSEDPMPARI